MRSLHPRSSLRFLVLATFLSLAGRAAADDRLGNDEVTLKNGGMLRGTILSSEPGVSVKLFVAGEKEPRTIPWSQVGDVEPNKFAPKAAGVQPGSAGPGYEAAPAPARVVAPAPTLGSPGVVRLHVDSPEPVVVRAHATAYGQVGAYGFVIDAARPVCASPCDKVVDGSSGQEFTVGGNGVSESRRFALSGMSGDVRLDVNPGSQGLRVGGVWLSVLGGTAVVTGAALLLTSALVSSTPTVTSSGALSSSGSGNGGLVTAGGVVTGVGAAALVGGIVMIVSSKTNVEVRPTGGATTGRAPRYWAGEF